MPLSGPYGSEGTKLAELIKLGIEDNLNGFISTTTYDVSTEDFLDQAKNKLALKNTKIILGPLFSPSVKQLEEFVKKHDIIMITLSNNPLLADDNHILIFGHAPLKQTNRLLGYLFAQGHKDFITLSPAGKTGLTLAKTLSDIIHANNANVVLSEYYENNIASIEQAISKIAPKIDEKMEEVENESKPVIIISEENKDILNEIFNGFKKHNIGEKALIVGDSRIDSAYNEPVNYLFTGSSTENNNLALKAKSQLGIERMNFLENLAYDLGAITSISIGQDFTKETFFSRLKSPVWYKGLSGQIRFNGSIAERKYSIIERKSNEYKIIDELN